jgi:hypothetical protein
VASASSSHVNTPGKAILWSWWRAGWTGMVNDVGHELQGPFVGGPMDTALAMVQLDIASLNAVIQFLRDM